MPEKTNILNLQLLSRVFLEALEIAFQECAEDRTNFGEAKVSYIVNSLVPTGYVLGTSYWFLYTDRRRGGKYFCVCERYGLQCSHKIDEKLTANFIDYCEPYYFSDVSKCFVAPVNPELLIDQHEDTVLITVPMDHIALIYFNLPEWKLDVIKRVLPAKPLQFCFNIVKPKYRMLEKIVMVPHPLSNSRYGRMIARLRMEFLSTMSYCPNKYILCEDTVQRVTLMPKQKEHIPDDVYTLAPIIQEFFTDTVYFHETHTYIPPDHVEKLHDYIICKHGEVIGSDGIWHFVRSVQRKINIKVEPDLDECVNRDDIATSLLDDLKYFVNFDIRKHPGFRILASSFEESTMDVAGIIDISDATLETKRIKPFKLNYNTKENYQVPIDAQKCAKLYNSYKNHVNSKA